MQRTRKGEPFVELRCEGGGGGGGGIGNNLGSRFQIPVLKKGGGGLSEKEVNPTIPR